jgi:hypothetical protein
VLPAFRKALLSQVALGCQARQHDYFNKTRLYEGGQGLRFLPQKEGSLLSLMLRFMVEGFPQPEKNIRD